MSHYTEAFMSPVNSFSCTANVREVSASGVHSSACWRTVETGKTSREKVRGVGIYYADADVDKACHKARVHVEKESHGDRRQRAAVHTWLGSLTHVLGERSNRACPGKPLACSLLGSDAPVCGLQPAKEPSPGAFDPFLGRVSRIRSMYAR